MVHEIDGFTASFTHRGSWKANLYRNGELIDTVPVTWTKGTRRDPATGEWFQRVWYQDQNEIERMRERTEPFWVIVALADDYNSFPHSVKHMNAIYKVASMGVSLEETTIECKVLDRIREPQ